MKQTRDTYGILGGVLDAREVARSTQVRLRCVSVGKPLNLELFVNNYLTMPPARYMPRCERPYEHPYEHRTNDGKNTVRTTVRTPYERRANDGANYGANYERELSRELRDAPVWGTTSGEKENFAV